MELLPLTDTMVPACPAPESAGERRRARRTLGLLAGVCVAPVLASYLAFYVWQPSGRVNHGELLAPAALPASPLEGVDGGGPALTRAALEGRWTLLYAGPAACPQQCERSLYAMRQARLAQGKEQDRVGRVWLVTGDGIPAAEAGLGVARARADWLAVLPDAAGGEHVYLVDPLGNVMMRFAPPVEGETVAAVRGIVKDLQRLLKYSQLGREGGAK